MKNSLFKAMLFIAVFGLTSCEKEIEGIINCLGEATGLNFDHSISSADPKVVTLTVMYSGDFTLQNTVQWDFGDGKKLTTSTTSTTHTYSASGTYTAKAITTVKKGDKSCEFENMETIIIN